MPCSRGDKANVVVKKTFVSVWVYILEKSQLLMSKHSWRLRGEVFQYPPVKYLIICQFNYSEYCVSENARIVESFQLTLVHTHGRPMI